MILPLKVNKPAGLRPTGDLALIALAAPPFKSRRPSLRSRDHKQHRVNEGKAKARGKKRSGNNGKRGNEVGEEVEEVYGTIAVMQPPGMLEEYKASERQVDQNCGSGGTGDKDNHGVSGWSAMGKGANTRGLVRSRIRAGQIINQTVKGQADQRTGDGAVVGDAGGSYAESLDEEVVQQAVARAVEASSLHQPFTRVEEIEETIGDSEHPGESEENGEEIAHQPSHRKVIIIDDDTESYQSSIHPDALHDDDETEIESESELTALPTFFNPRQQVLQLPTPVAKSVRPKLPSQPPTFPLTPASISYVNPTPLTPSSTHQSSPISSVGISAISLTTVTGPARWKLPRAKQNRFSGPKVYTPLTLHPPSGGLGMVDYVRVPRRSRGGQRWEGSKRQVSFRPHDGSVCDRG